MTDQRYAVVEPTNVEPGDRLSYRTTGIRGRVLDVQGDRVKIERENPTRLDGAGWWPIDDVRKLFWKLVPSELPSGR